MVVVSAAQELLCSILLCVLGLIALRNWNPNAWVEFRDQIAEDFGFSTDLSDRELWDFIWQDLVVKMSRWFSWNEACNNKLKEFHVVKMILSMEYAGESCAPPDDDDKQSKMAEHLAQDGRPANHRKGNKGNVAQELQSLKKKIGAFRLAYHLMTESLFDHCKVFLYATKPL